MTRSSESHTSSSVWLADDSCPSTKDSSESGLAVSKWTSCSGIEELSGSGSAVVFVRKLQCNSPYDCACARERGFEYRVHTCTDTSFSVLKY